MRINLVAFLGELSAIAMVFGLPSSQATLGAIDSRSISPACNSTNTQTFTPGYIASSVNHITSGGRTRKFALNLPAGINDASAQPWPLIIDFHGAGKTSANQYNNSMYWAYPQAQNYIIVYPQGGANYSTPGVDDVLFVSDLLDYLKGTFCLDEDRFYASGKSNGGGFVDTLACSDVGDNFAAFAMASAALYTDLSLGSCTKQRAILESHGTNDKTVPYVGPLNGNGGPLPDIATWFTWWGQRDGCQVGDEVMQTTTKSTGVYDVYSYSCAGETNVAQHYKVHGLGHCWPSAFGNNSDALGSSACGVTVLDHTPVVFAWFGRWNGSNKPGL